MTCMGDYEVKPLVYDKFIEKITNVYVLTAC